MTKRDAVVVVVVDVEHEERRPPWYTRIGGPTTTTSVLSFTTNINIMMESFICWMFALSCLLVSGYYFIVENYSFRFYNCHSILDFIRKYFDNTIGYSFTRLKLQVQRQHASTAIVELPCWIPIMTCSRSELLRCTTQERYEQLLHVLRSIIPPKSNSSNGFDTDTGSISNQNKSKTYEDDLILSDDELVQIVRNHEIVRRLVSLALRPPTVADRHHSSICKYIVRQQPLAQQLIRVWHRLLDLPSSIPSSSLPSSIHPKRSDDGNSNNETDHDLDCHHHHHYKIALIVPYYREQPIHVIQKIQYALLHCNEPQYVHVILVIAGCTAEQDHQQIQLILQEQHVKYLPVVVVNSGNGTATTYQRQQPNNDDSSDPSQYQHQWGKFQIVEYRNENGRGPAMNYGTTFATTTTSNHNNNINLIYTFCHSDTILPYHWDATILESLSSHTPTARRSINNACAFKFGIDTSVEGLLQGTCSGTDVAPTRTATLKNNESYYYYPPGIHAIEYTANIRCYLWSLPYGDQCISMRAFDFQYIGGYPHQCIMEDYDLVALLRKRTKLLSQLYKYPTQSATSCMEKEELHILPGPPVLCSPRRWQKYGVFYVTYTNSRLVKLYNSSLSILPETIYQLYYGQSLLQGSDATKTNASSSSSSTPTLVLSEQTVPTTKSPWETQLDEMLLQLHDKRD